MDKIFVPPIKIQGIKTKLVPLIKEYVSLNENTLWIEPFTGSGSVGFNVKAQRAIFSDINPHLINFYNALKLKKISHITLQKFLYEEGKILSERGENYYYEVRERFNRYHDSSDFLFINRACFNGMIRFNRKGQFNVPYCHKPQRFSKAYITKIANQVKYIESCLSDFDWEFVCQDFQKTLRQAREFDDVLIYCDPPYIGRHVDYFDSWDEQSEIRLHHALFCTQAKFMVSTWDHNRYRSNHYISSVWSDCEKTTHEHFYYVGARETNRNPVVEALLTNYVTNGG